MAWLQLRVASAHPEFAEEVLLAHGASAVTLLDAADHPLLEPAPGATPLWPRTLTLGLFPTDADVEAVRASLRELLPDGAEARVDTALVEDQDWVRLWLRDCPPVRFGERLWVVPRARRGEVADPAAIVVMLDPGLAFGTGTHPTTALCLSFLAGLPLAGARVLDYGCGSGILAVAALKLGAAQAFGVDLDPQALLATRDNAEVNGVAARLQLLDVEAALPAVDVVVANILANPLIALAPRLCDALVDGGRLALAGLLERQADEVRAAYAPWLEFDADVAREGWTRISGRRRRRANFRQTRGDF